MTCFTGFVAAVPTANKQKYLDHAKSAWPMFQRYGATRMVECWGADVQKGKVTDFQGAVQAKDDETVVFSWIEWPDRATAEKGWEAMRTDPAAQNMQAMPFDGSRMIFGDFEPVFEAGQHSGAGYYQGFILAVPKKNRPAYVKMAGEAWGMFEKYGCLGIAENWGVDVPHGKLTDFYRATKAKPGEAAVFSWTAWPDRATCDAAARKMMAEMEGQQMPEMPFDGMRMVWGGFDPILDTGDRP